MATMLEAMMSKQIADFAAENGVFEDNDKGMGLC
jgi:hypothetical protein